MKSEKSANILFLCSKALFFQIDLMVSIKVKHAVNTEIT